MVHSGIVLGQQQEEQPLLPPICPNLTVGPHCFCLSADIHSDDKDADDENLGITKARLFRAVYFVSVNDSKLDTTFLQNKNVDQIFFQLCALCICVWNGQCMKSRCKRSSPPFSHHSSSP